MHSVSRCQCFHSCLTLFPSRLSNQTVRKTDSLYKNKPESTKEHPAGVPCAFCLKVKGIFQLIKEPFRFGRFGSAQLLVKFSFLIRDFAWDFHPYFNKLIAGSA